MRINEIEEIIPHESFNHRAINRRHDIGLIRLKRSVQYTSKKLCHFSLDESLNSLFLSQVLFDLFVYLNRPSLNCEPVIPFT